MSTRISLAVLALGAGCLAPADDVETSVGEQQIIHDDCTTWGCGTNSPVFDAVAFFDLSEKRLPNTAGYYIASFRKDSTSPDRRIDVLNGQILARSMADGSVVASGYALLNWQLEIKHKDNGSYYKVQIAEVQNSKATPFWHNPNNLAVFPWTYKLAWQTGNMTWWEEVCGNPSGFSQDGLADFHAVVFEGDRIDGVSKVVYGEDASWFNIGCGGHALAKQHLTAHTRVASKLMQLPTPTFAQRTAHLKALVADYCGDGTPYTVAGEKLGWKSTNGFSNVPAINAGVEAIWSETGAVCLTEPRIDQNQSMLGMQQFPNGVAEIVAKKCPKSACDRSHAGDVTSVLKYSWQQ